MMGAVGGAAGADLGKIAGPVLQPLRSNPNPALQNSMTAAESIGYRVPAGQQTGSRGQSLVRRRIAASTRLVFHYCLLNNASRALAINSVRERSLSTCI